MSEIPNPGSPEAVAQNCCCPVLDNGHGIGAWGGMRKDGELLFWIVPDCPLHGEKREDSRKSDDNGDE